MRGCGNRIEAGVYIECTLSKNGQPLEHFLIDPPIEFQPASTLGVSIVEMEGVYHVFDYVGAQSYPHPADFLEEVRAQGLSRRVKTKLQWHLLTVESKIFIIHQKAVLMNLQEYVDLGCLNTALHNCGLAGRLDGDGSPFHFDYPHEMCSRYHWMLPTVEGLKDDEAVEILRQGQASCLWRDFIGAAYPTHPPTPSPFIWERSGAAADYRAQLPEPIWATGLIASFPISQVGIVTGPSGRHNDVLQEVRGRSVESRKAGTTPLPIREVKP